MSELRTSPLIAKVHINRQIEAGRKLVEQLEGANSAQTYEELLAVKGREYEWSEGNVRLLKVELFGDDSQVRRYLDKPLAMIGEGIPLSEEKYLLCENIRRKIGFLKALSDRVDEFPRAEIAPHPL